MRILKKTAIWLGVCLALSGFLVQGFLVSLQYAPVQRIIREQVNELFPGMLQWDRLKFSLLNGTISLEGFAIEGADGSRIAGLTSLEVQLSLRKLSDNIVAVEKFHGKGLWADIRRDSSGGFNIVNAFVSGPSEPKPEADTSAAGWNVIVEDLRLELDTAGYHDALSGMEAGLQHLHVSGNGNLSLLEVSLGLELDSAWMKDSVKTIPLSRFSLMGKLISGGLDTVRAAIKSLGSSVVVSGRVENLFSAPRFDVSGIIAADLEKIGQVFMPGMVNTGVINGEVAFSGLIENPVIRLAADYGGGLLSGQSVESITLQVSLDSLLCRIPRLTAASGGGKATLEGAVDLSEAFPEGLTGAVRNLDALAYTAVLLGQNINLSRFEHSLPSGTVGLKLAAEGKGVSPGTMTAGIKLSAQAIGLTVDKRVTPLNADLKADAVIRDGAVTVKQLTLHSDSLQLDAEGRIEVEKGRARLKLNLSVPSLAHITEPLGVSGLSGSGDIKLLLEGQLSSPTATVELRTRDLTYKNTGIGNIEMQAGLDTTGQVVLTQLAVRNGQSSLDARGRADIFSPGSLTPIKEPRFEITAESPGIRAEDFLDSIRGTAVLSAAVSGTPGNMNGGMELTVSDLESGAQRFESIIAKVRLLGDTAMVDSLRVRLSAGSELKASGFYTFSNVYGFSVSGRNLPLKSIDKVREMELMEGNLSLDISGQGSTGNPEITGTASLSGFRLSGEELKGLEAAFSLKDRTAALKTSGLMGADAHMGLDSGIFLVSAVFDSTDLGPFMMIAGQKDMSGRIHGMVKAQGRTGDIAGIVAEADIGAILLRFQDMVLLQGGSIRGRYAGGGFSFPEFEVAILEKGRLKAKGEGTAGGTMDLALNGNIPLEAAVLFGVDLPDLTGMFLVDARLEGSMVEPHIQATAKLAGASFTIPVLEQSLHSLNAEASFDTRGIVLKDLKGNIDDGIFQLKGSLALNAMKPGAMQASLTATNLPVSMPRMLDAVFDGALDLRGDTSGTKISGEIILLEGLFYQKINLAGMLKPGERKRKIAAAPDTATSGFMVETLLDVSVKNRTPFLVDNNLAYMEIKPDVQIKGTLSKPVVSGRGKVESGIIKWKQRDFRITRGVIDFLNPYRTEATLDVESEIGIRSWLIQLGISGPVPDGLILKLAEKNSSPPLEDGEILSILATNKTTAELMGGGEGGKSKEQLMAALLASAVSSRLQGRTGLDRLEIEAGGEDSGKSAGDVRVTLGKNLSRRLATLYSIESASGSLVQRGTAEYKLLQDILISGFQDTEGRHGGAMEWNLEWR